MYAPPSTTDGPERMLLEGLLDRTRSGLIDTVRGLSESDARRRLVPSMTTPIGLLRHAAFAERMWFQHRFLGLSASACDVLIDLNDPGVGGWNIDSADSVSTAITAFQETSQRSRDIAAEYDLDQTTRYPVWDLGRLSLRWIYLHLIEEFARHAGHGDILREQLLS